MPKVLEDVKPRVGKEVAHLTYHRLRVAEDAKTWRNGDIWMAIRDALRLFLDEAPDSRISPATKSTIRRYL